MNQCYDSLPSTQKMPALFVGHGSPMNAIADNDFNRRWRRLGQTLMRPRAIVSISAHWLTLGKTLVTRMPAPPTLHDFSGFPHDLYQLQYPAPGDLALADQIVQKLDHTLGSQSWGLDHGTWSVLMAMYPDADIPVVQLSIDLDMTPQTHFKLGQALQDLRYCGVMIMGSGNLVHNLAAMGHRRPYDWALEFDTRLSQLIDAGDDQAVVDAPRSMPHFRRAHPTEDHFLPLLYVLAVRNPQDRVEHFNARFDLASVSMRGIILH